MLAELVWQCVAMTRRVRPVLAVAVIFVGLTVAGCVLGRSREEPAGPRVTGMAPRSMFAPRKPPAGLSLESVVTGPTLAGIPTAVYGARGDVLTGRMVAAFRVLGGWEDMPRGGTPIHLNGKDKAQSGTVGDMTWIAWRIDPHSNLEDAAAYEGVVGRGLSATEIRTAAEKLTGDGEHVRIGNAGVPKDLRLLSSQPIPWLEAGDQPFPGGTRLTWSDRSRRTWLALDLLGRDTMTEAWARVFAPEESSRIRGTAGAVTRLRAAPQRVPFFYQTRAYGPPIRFRVWQEKNTIAVISGVGVSQSTVDELVKNLHPVGQEELEALRRSIARYPPERLGPRQGDGGRFVAGGNAQGATWAVFESGDTIGDHTDVVVERLNTNGTSDRRYGWIPDDQPSPLSLVQNQYPDIVVGRALRVVKRVRYEGADGTSSAIQLSHTTTPDGLRWFTGMKQPGPGTLIAYDTTEKVIDRKPVD
jgi:hypothetical protein